MIFDLSSSHAHVETSSASPVAKLKHSHPTEPRLPGLILGTTCALLLTFAGTTAAAATSLLLIDHSGSMMGFDETRSVPMLVRTLRENLSVTSETLWLVSHAGETTRLVAGDQPPGGYGSQTRLMESVGLARDQHRRADSLWLLTDNVPSLERPDQDLDRLYDWLRRGESQGGPPAVTLFVLKLPFEGPIYRLDGHTRLSSNYRGERSVVLYAALLDASAAAEFHSQVDRVAESFRRSYRGKSLRLRCKPLQRDSVEMRIVEVKGGGLSVTGNGVMEGHGVEGLAFRGTFGVRLRSSLENVEFRNVRPSFEASRAFRTTDFDTPTLSSELAERSIEEIGKGWTGFDVTLALEPARLRRTWKSAVKAFFRGDDPGILDGSVRLALEVDRKSVVIVPEDVEGFSTDRDLFDDPSPEVQSRVYRLQELFQEKFVESSLSLVPTIETASGEREERREVPVRILVQYSPLHAFVLIGIPALLFGLPVLLSLWYLSAFRTRYKIQGGGADERPFRFWIRRTVRGSTGVLGTLHQVPPVLWFTAGRKWAIEGTRKVSRRLPREGGSIRLRPAREAEGAQPVHLTVRRVRGTGSGSQPSQRPGSSQDPFSAKYTNTDPFA